MYRSLYYYVSVSFFYAPQIIFSEIRKSAIETEIKTPVDYLPT